MDIAQAMGFDCGTQDSGACEERAIALVISSIKKLAQDIGIPENLAELGVQPDDFSTLADNALKDACGLTNPIQPDKAHVVALFEKAYTQRY